MGGKVAKAGRKSTTLFADVRRTGTAERIDIVVECDNTAPYKELSFCERVRKRCMSFLLALQPGCDVEKLLFDRATALPAKQSAPPQRTTLLVRCYSQASLVQ